MSNFAARVRVLAENQALSISEVERRCGWKKGQLTTTLKTNNPTLNTIRTIAGALGVAAEELIK